MGPRSRELLSSLTDSDLSNEAFPFATSREIDLGLAFVRASRMTYVGELGWELWIPSDVALHVYDMIVAAGEGFGLRHAGFHAMDSLRIEKAYRSWGHDIGEVDSSLEAGLGFTHDFEKPGGFIGREAILRQRDVGPPAPARRVRPRRPGAAPRSQRADLAGRRPLRTDRVGGLRPHGRSVGRAGIRRRSRRRHRDPRMDRVPVGTSSRSRTSGSRPRLRSGRSTTRTTSGSGRSPAG